MDNLSERCLGVQLLRYGGRSLKARERLAGLVNPAHAHQVPRRLGCEAQGWDQKHRPHPLQSKRNAVAPFVRARDQAGEDAGGNELADDEAHVGPAGEEDAEAHGQHLGGVGGRAGDEDAPRQAAEELADEQHGDALREEGDEDEAGEHDERGDDDALLAKLGNEVAGGDDAEEAADLAGVAETGLPGGGELVTALLVDELAVLFGEFGVGIKVANENRVVAWRGISTRGNVLEETRA